MGDHLGEGRFRRTPRLERSGADHRLLARARQQIRDHVVGDHLLHLVRHPGHRVDDARAAVGQLERGADAGRGADRIRDRLGTDGDVGLAQVVLGHLAGAGPEDPLDVVDELLAPLELDAHDLGDHLAGDVVGRGPDAAADDHGVGLRDQVTQRAHHAREVVADLAVVVGVDARLGQLLADPGTVGVDDLPEEQFGSDGEHVAAHAG